MKNIEEKTLEGEMGKEEKYSELMQITRRVLGVAENRGKNMHYKCWICMDKGIVTYPKTKWDNAYEFVARCTCAAGDRYPWAILITEVADGMSIRSIEMNNRELMKPLEGCCYTAFSSASTGNLVNCFRPIHAVHRGEYGRAAKTESNKSGDRIDSELSGK